MKKGKGILSLILTIVLIGLLGFTTAVGFGKGHTGSAQNIKLGLDLAGGVSITYKVKDGNPTDSEMNDTIYKLQKRVEQYSTEASVYQEGKDRINIEIPVFPMQMRFWMNLDNRVLCILFHRQTAKAKPIINLSALQEMLRKITNFQNLWKKCRKTALLS